MTLTERSDKNITLSILYTIVYILFPPLWLVAFLGIGLYGKYFKNKATSIFNRYILPPTFVIIIFFCIFKANDIYPFGTKTIAWCDMSQQGVPYWMNFKSILEGEDSIFLNMANAAGMNGWSLLRGLLFSPFSYIALFIERNSMMDAVTVLQVLKFAACSVTAMVFFKICYKKLHPSLAVTFSLMYSFCAFGLMYSQIITWPDAMYLCPLYFAGVYLLITKGKIYLYAVSLAFVMNNFAFGFMMVIATVLFIGYYLMVCKDSELSKRVGFNFVAGSVIAAFLSASSWLPFFGAYGSSARGVDIADNIASQSFFTKKNTAYPLLMSTALITVAAFSFKGTKKNPMQKALYFLFGMMLIPMIIEPISLMWHGGSYTSFPSRYAYILTFVGLAIAGMLFSACDEELSTQNESSKNRYIAQNLCACFFLLIVIKFFWDFVKNYVEKNIHLLNSYAVSLWGDNNSYIYTSLLFVMFVAVYALCYGFYKTKFINKQILALMFAIILVIEAYCAISIYIVPSTYKVDTESFRTYADLSDRIEDDGFYRVKNEKFLDAAYNISEANFPGAIGYASMGHYSSLTSETYLHLSKALGYSSMWMKVESFGGTKFSDALMSVKYGIDTASDADTDVVYKNELYQIEKKDIYLPLGLFIDNNDITLDLSEVERIELQEMIYDALTGNQYDLFNEIEPFAISGCTYLPSEARKDDRYTIKLHSEDEAAYLQYKIVVEGTKTLYFDCFDQFSNNLDETINNAFSISVNGKSSFKYPTQSNNGLRNLGTFTDTEVTVKVKVLENVSCRSFGLYAMDDNVLKETLDDIDTAGLSVDGNTINGKYNAEKDGYLLVSIPWDEGFEYEVNGKEAEIVKAFGGFIAIPVSAGENSIVLSYTPPMFYGSMVLVALGILLCLAVYIILKRTNSSCLYDFAYKKLGEKITISVSKIVVTCITIAFVAVIALVYILPLYWKLSTYG